MMAIPLTQGKFALIEDKDFEFINGYKWFAQKQINTFYAGRMVQHESGKRRVLSMHRALMGAPLGGFEIDHIDGNGVNNQRSNLRIVTRRQNMQNAVNSRIKVTSKYPGVSYDSFRRKWKAYIKIDGVHIDIGRFNSETEAFLKYKTAVEAIGENVLPFREIAA